MVSIARKNLFHDKGRLATTLIGLAAALVLILLGMGMFVGTLDESVVIVDAMSAEIWAAQAGVDTVIDRSQIPAGAFEAIAQVRGVERAYPLIYTSGQVERGARQTEVMVVGLDQDGGLRGWGGCLAGKKAELQRGGVLVDRSVQTKLGRLSAGDEVSVNGHPLPVADLCQGAKWFIFPFVIASYERAQELAPAGPGRGNFLLVRVQPGAEITRVSKEISQIEGLAAFSSAEIRRNTRHYMTFESMMGLAIGIMVVIGLFVAVTIISLTIYTATMERIPEFGTLKAIGASRRQIYQILLEQVVISVVLGYLLGATGAFATARLITTLTPMPVKITWGALLLSFVLTLGLSLLGSFSSVRRVNRVDPAIVFRA